MNRRRKTVAPAMPVNDKVRAFTRCPAGDAMMKRKEMKYYNARFAHKITKEPALRIIIGKEEESKETFKMAA